MESTAEIEYISGFSAVGKDLLKLYTDNSKQSWLYVLSVEGMCQAHWCLRSFGLSNSLWSYYSMKFSIF